MKATGYLQIRVSRTAAGKPLRLTLGPVTQRFPRTPEPGAIVTKLELDVDDALLRASVLEGRVPARAATIVLEVKDHE